MGSLLRSTAGRVVHLKITPRPSNLGESREIMRLLSQFGEIEYYKNFRYDEHALPHSAIAMYKTRDSANDCLKRSPIRFRMGKASAFAKEQEVEENETPVSSSEPEPEPEQERSVPRGPMGTPFGLGATQTRSMSTSNQLPKPPRNNMNVYLPFDPPPEGPPSIDESRVFQIQVNPSTRHLRDHINQGHYHSHFAIDTKMVGQGDLAKKVPTPGLSCIDWKAMEQPWYVTKRHKDDDYTGPKRRRRLGELWEEGEEERAGKPTNETFEDPIDK